MASLEIEVVTEEIEKISKENGSCEIRTETVTEALVAISSKESFLTKEKSADSDVLTYNDDDLENEEDNIARSLQSNDSKSEKSQEQSACSQSSKASSNSTKSSFNSINHKSQSRSSSTIKDDEDSRSSFSSSTSAIKTSQPVSNKSDDESNSATSFSTNSRRSSPEKQSQNESTFKRSQSVNTNLTEDNDSRSSIISSNSRSTTKNSQPMDNKSDDETRSSVKNIEPAKDTAKTKQKKYFSIVDSDSENEIFVPSKSGHDTRNSDSDTNESKSQKTVKKSKSKNKTKVLDSDSEDQSMKSQKERQSDNDKDSNTILTIENSQSVNDTSDGDNSRSSFQSSRKRTSPEKESENESTFKKSQSVNTNLTEDNDSRSSISLNSRSTTKNSQPMDNKSDDETRASVKNIVPAKDSVKTKQKKYFSIVDSDSDDEIFVPSKSGHGTRNSDSDTNESISEKTVKKSKVKNKSKVLDSDSDEESSKSKKIHKKKQSNNDKSSSDSEKEESKPINKSNKISSIVDSDSESDSNHHSEPIGSAFSGEENYTNKSKAEKKKSEKKRVGSVRASKDAAMQQIHSETQRLMREQELSLPYHRPKQRTLQEFLNRKKITSVIPKNLTCAEKVKMFPDVISQVVEEKEKEAEIFYQSSDSEEDEKQDEAMEIDQISIKNTDQSEFNNQNFDKMNIGDTQKLTQDNIQECHNKREILQQRSLEFGVPRKLFMEDAGIMEEAEKVLTSQNCLEDENDLNTDDVAAVRKKNKETKAGLRESSIPRKLFAGNAEEMDIDADVDIDDASTAVTGAELEETVKTIENSEKKVDSVENETTLNNSNEDIVLNMSETEFDSSGEKTLIESNDVSKLSVQNKDEESIMIAETPMISHKDPLRSNRLSLVAPNEQDTIEKEIIKEFNEIKDSEDPILKLNAKNSDEEILDSNALEGDFRLPPELEEPKKPSLKEQILANALKIKPRIKALPGQMIDFTDSGQMKEGVTRLLDRFARHSVIHKPVVNEIAEVKIIRTEGVGDDITIVEEILPFKKIVIADDGKKESKPGEKLKKLREDLKQKIATARNEEWRQKEENEQENEEDQESIKGKGDDFYEGLPDEEELLEDEESSESEPEEDDIPLVDKPRKKCAFGDEEAEESETEDVEDFDGNEIEEDDEEEVQEDNIEKDSEEEDEEDEDDEDESEEEQIDMKPKKLRRIIKPFEEEDSDDPDSNVDNVVMPNSSSKSKNADEDIFDSQASNDNVENDIILPFQRERMGSDSHSQACKTPLPKANNLLNMISPVAQLTALNTSLDSAKNSASKTNNFEFDRISGTNTSSNRTQTNCNMEKMINLQKKLFDDAPEKVNEDELLGICSGKFTNPQSSSKYSSSAPSEVTDSQLMDLCSGAFGTQQISMKKLESTDPNPNPNYEANNEILKIRNGVTDSQLMELCSGGFISQSPNVKKLELTAKNLQLTDETSQDITLTLDDDEDSTNFPVKASTSVKKSDESMFSSDSKSPITLPSLNQAVSKNPMEAWLSKAKKPSVKTEQKKNVVTDSELMDLCSGTFTTQIADMKELEKNHASQIHDEMSQDFHLTLDDNSNSSVKKVSKNYKNCQLKEPEPSIKQSVAELEVPGNKFTIASSSDEDEDSKSKKKRTKKKLLKKKKVQKLQLSDDEDEEQNEFSEAEESEEYEEEEEENFVDYDSEENEVVVVPKKEIKKVAAKFLENEAELSESDWDSADEDEQGLDRLDFEEADAEDIDEAKMKVQLDKIHMKQVMDDDQREVRMLQELLFDDGDLHSEGAGRERKFKWKNIDKLGDNELGPTIDDGEAIDDEVDSAAELQIRKMRYEQHKFLKDKEEKQIDPELENDLNDSPLTKFGLKIVSVRSASKTIIEEKKLTKSNSDGAVLNNAKTKQFKRTLTNTTKLSFSNMRGSFLSRGDETLVRIAQNLQESNKLPLNAGRKGKFVFEHISPSVKDAKEELDQENDNTPTQEKNNRKRKIFASQTPRTTKKPKVDNRAPGKKLF